jgi:hypothetical protein
MKNFFLTLTLLSFVQLSISAQNKPCGNPINQSLFNQSKNLIASQSGDNNKLRMANSRINSQCMNATQIREIALLFASDAVRHEFAVNAFTVVFDKENFFDVFDAFGSFSAVFRLYDQLYNSNTATRPDRVPPPRDRNPSTPPTTKSPTPQFPVLNYPNAAGYKGNSPCTNPMDENTFNAIAQSVYNLNTDQEKSRVLQSVSSANCVTVSQAMKLASLITNEGVKLSYLQSSFNKMYDQDNLTFAVDIFSESANRRELIDFISANRKVETPIEQPSTPVKEEICFVTPLQLSELKASIENESFDNSKLSLAQQLIATFKCFSTEQIIEIVNLLGFEKSKLELAKYAYDYTIDKENYHKVGASFSFDASRRELMNHIRKR